MKKLSKIIALDAEEKTSLWRKFKTFCTSDDLSGLGFIPQHLYFISDEQDFEEMEVGYHIEDGSIGRRFIQEIEKGKLRKVVATTDTGYKDLPRPSNEFIRKYCELGGIDEVLIEYFETKDFKEIDEYVRYSYPNIEPDWILAPKVAPDNTITIYPVK